MTKQEWIKKINSACKQAGTYQPQFKHVIETLAQIMEERDTAHDQYVEGGSQPTVIHVNKAKEANVAKNPALMLEMDLNTQALAYWRDLGLTPAGLRKLNADAVKEKPTGNLEQILAGIAS